MNELMKTLFSTLELSGQSEEEAQAVKAANPAVQAAQQRLTYDEFEDLWNAIAGIERASDLDSFTQGFRLGVQLTLEGLRPVYPPDPAAPAARPDSPQ